MQFTGIMKNLDRLPSSRDGNPRWTWTIDGTRISTRPDSSLGYEVDNHQGRRVKVAAKLFRGLWRADNVEQCK